MTVATRAQITRSPHISKSKDLLGERDFLLKKNDIFQYKQIQQALTDKNANK